MRAPTYDSTYFSDAPVLSLVQPRSELPPPEPPVMCSEDKTWFLTDRHTLGGIRTVARRRGVPRDQWEEVVQQTCTRAWRTRLPAEPDEARMVVNRIAALVSGALLSPPMLGEPVALDDVDEEELSATAADPASDAELRDQLERLLDEARTRFPRRFDAYMASVLGHYPSAVEARERGVTDGQVRKERSQVRRFLQEHGQKMGLLAVAALVLFVFGSMKDWTRSSHIERDGDGSMWSPSRREVVRPAASAASLRTLAAEEYRAGDYDAFLRDLDAAEALDGHSDTPDEAQMRADAMRELRATDEAHSKK
jgi:hypothetical protein